MSRPLISLLASAAMLTTALVGNAVAEPARAGQTTVVYGEGQTPSSEELRRVLFGAPPAPAATPGPRMRTRGLVLLPATGEVATPAITGSVMKQASSPAPEPAVSAPPVAAPTPSPAPAPTAPIGSLAFQIRFAFDSAQVPASAMVNLASLAEAIKGAPSERPLRIVGHTDSVGSDRYNEDLSQRRAEATRRVLIERFGVSPRRLIAYGVGEQEQIVGVAGDDPANRRVEFTTSG